MLVERLRTFATSPRHPVKLPELISIMKERGLLRMWDKGWAEKDQSPREGPPAGRLFPCRDL